MGKQENRSLQGKHDRSGKNLDEGRTILRYVGKILDRIVLRIGLWHGRFTEGSAPAGRKYDQEMQRPVLKCSICNGEQVAGFKDIRTGRFEEIALIRNQKELDDFMRSYGIHEISKEY